ncbi:MAG TPA: N-acetyl-gamma-glutamyl-phosphate reductase [Desulfuromonadales bacterium]|nr:N-acetyl-gamma-glutamyl-phosphate reductase [Desulfuromonadales bacterium]
MYRVSVVGASGYTGAELLRLLAGHDQVAIASVTSRQYAGQPVSAQFPSLRGCVEREFELFDPAAMAKNADVVFTAVPHQTAMEMVPALLDCGVRVIDLSADFRLSDADVYASWYQQHTAPELLDEAVYGLPELFRGELSAARLVANPGCYPTGAALALAPLLEERLIQPASIVIDSKSGASGAGRGAKVPSLFCEVNEGFRAYGLPRHRHTPEIEQTLGRLAGSAVTISFTPHLVPANRGILTTCYAALDGRLDQTALLERFTEYYLEEPFVRVLPTGQLPNIAHVAGSNFCDIGLVTDPRTGRVVVISAIDNLVKGAAGQAVQNMNLLLELPETAGLLQPPVFP